MQGSKRPNARTTWPKGVKAHENYDIRRVMSHAPDSAYVSFLVDLGMMEIIARPVWPPKPIRFEDGGEDE